MSDTATKRILKKIGLWEDPPPTKEVYTIHFTLSGERHIISYYVDVPFNKAFHSAIFKASKGEPLESICLEVIMTSNKTRYINMSHISSFWRADMVITEEQAKKAGIITKENTQPNEANPTE